MISGGKDQTKDLKDDDEVTNHNFSSNMDVFPLHVKIKIDFKQRVPLTKEIKTALLIIHKAEILRLC